MLAPGGRLLVETAGDPHVDRALTVRFSRGRRWRPARRFGWAEVGIEALAGRARAAGYSVTEVWSAGGRTFAALAR